MCKDFNVIKKSKKSFKQPLTLSDIKSISAQQRREGTNKCPNDKCNYALSRFEFYRTRGL